VNLTNDQWDLLRSLVLSHESAGGAEFHFTQSHTGAGISYTGIQGSINCSETDLHQLRSERLITLIRVSSNVHRGKPTQLGITMARRDSTVFENSFEPANGTGEWADPFRANAEVAMAKLPELSERSERIFSLRWSTLLDESRLTEKVIVQCANASNVTRRNALSKTPGSTNRYFQMTDYLRARNECGISQSVRLAERWFHELATEYMKRWSPGDGFELFASWLEVLRMRVLTDVASIWGNSQNTKRWYENVCAPAVGAGVSAKLSEFERLARAKELDLHVRARLAEGGFSKTKDAVTPKEPRPATEQRESPEASYHSDMESGENVQAATARELAQEIQTPVKNDGSAVDLGKPVSSWEEIEIRFLSEERVQIIAGKETRTLNYAEFGFEDGRSEKPNLAWIALRSMATLGGTIRQPNSAQDWSSVEKRMQEIRKVLRTHFSLSDDPLPFVEDVGYRACFKISLAQSFES
jgi:hypothetical protein